MAQITGTAGDDNLDGTIFQDTIEGLGGDDFIEGHDADDTLSGNEDDDEIWAGEGDDWLYGGDDDDTLHGERGNDEMYGGEGADLLISYYGDDELYGGDGNDHVEFSWEDDIVEGGDGDDWLDAQPRDRTGGAYLPVISGGAGEDTLSFNPQIGSDNERHMFVDLSTSMAVFSYTFTRYDILLGYIDSAESFFSVTSGIENLDGTTGNDTLVGDSGSNELDGRDGDDALFGGGGNDELHGGSGSNDLYGGSGNDEIHAIGASDLVGGNEGDDTIWAYDLASVDVDGGTDTDTLYIEGVDASAAAYVLGAAGNLSGIEVFRFRETYNTVAPYDGDLDLVLDASLGADLHDSMLTVVAGDGDDILDASNIADSVNVVLQGGEGDDFFENLDSANIMGGDVFDGGGGIDTLDLDEYLASWGGPKVLVGDNSTVAGVEIINLHGSLATAGINNIELAIPLANTSSTGNVTVNGYGLAQDFIDGSRIANSAVSLFLNGNGGNDVLTGGAGADMLNGGTGGDGMAGGSGSDTYLVDSVSDTVTENLLAGWSDGVIASVDFTLGANIEELALSGAADIDGTGNGIANEIAGNSGRNTLSGLGGIDHLYGGAGDDDLFGGEGDDTLEGGSESDELDGGTGADIMQGGSGDDVYTVDNVGDVVTELSNQGAADMIMASVSQIVPFNVENLWLLGTGNIFGIGNGLDNLLVGNGGNNALTGLAGIDGLYGFGGDDFLLGGVGGDTLDGGEGSDTALYTGSAAVSIDLGAQISVGGDAAGDSFTSIENVIGSSFADGIIGDAAANILVGGGGVDTMAGGDGNDSFYADNGSDTVVETASAAAGLTDTIFASVNFTSFVNVERLYLTGASNLNGTGVNDQNDVIYGNSGNNILDGLTGADNMNGGLGNDSYYVNTSADIVTEAAGAGTGLDTIFAQTGYTTSLNVERLYLLNGGNYNATGRDGQNDFLAGNDGANAIDGFSGDDTIRGGLGNDTLTGGAGIDIFQFLTTPQTAANRDTITDFSPADDVIQLDNFAYPLLTTNGALAVNLFRNLTLGAQDADDVILYDDATGALYYDANGLTAGGVIQFALLTSNPTVTAADFVVV